MKSRRFENEWLTFIFASSWVIIILRAVASPATKSHFSITVLISAHCHLFLHRRVAYFVIYQRPSMWDGRCPSPAHSTPITRRGHFHKEKIHRHRFMPTDREIERILPCHRFNCWLTAFICLGVLIWPPIPHCLHYFTPISSSIRRWPSAFTVNTGRSRSVWGPSFENLTEFEKLLP